MKKNSLTELLATDDLTLTDNQKKYLENRMAGKSETQSAMEAYSCEDNTRAREVSRRLENNENFRQNIVKLFNISGMSLEYLLTEHFRLIDESDSERTRLEAIKLAYNILGVGNKAKMERSVDRSKHQNINIYGDKSLAELRKEINELRRDK